MLQRISVAGGCIAADVEEYFSIRTQDSLPFAEPRPPVLVPVPSRVVHTAINAQSVLKVEKDTSAVKTCPNLQFPLLRQDLNVSDQARRGRLDVRYSLFEAKSSSPLILVDAGEYLRLPSVVIRIYLLMCKRIPSNE